ncbi:hypothetical protein GUA46_08020 [Muricauda sp. HICW]|uniref:Uncharacterized protein n=1 Tax=Flagellimonas chongwuensis TaxID=2697365 RepID=A0A850NE36_9FLAO|nr:DUF6090 family protein [Allomuricauda chongwuensis]NVN18284.1 hypothetical protein [Allomuricauda chongwuensis]
MIKFFRRIRQRLLSENKFSQYLLYAIGEIILVVIGILIALQFNNWNENQKNNTIRRSYSLSLISDLQKDNIALNSLISQLQTDSLNFVDIENKIKASNSNLDTIAEVFRYQFPAFIRSDYSFNNTTLINLIGDNTVSYPPEIRQSMAEVIKYQNDFDKTNTNLIYEYFSILNENSQYPMENYFFDSGKAVRDKIWENADPLQLAADFERVADWKMAYTMVILQFARGILKSNTTLKSDLEQLEDLK